MHGLSSGQAHIIALLSAAAGIPLAAAIQFSRSATKKGRKDLTSHPIARRKICFSLVFCFFEKVKAPAV